MTAGTQKCALVSSPIDPEAWLRSPSSPACGAEVVFIGRVRGDDEGEVVTSLTYEAFVPMAEAVFREIREEACAKFGVPDCGIVHRVGRLDVGEVAVVVWVRGGHRAEAFEACRYAVDELKRRAPIWKKEETADGRARWLRPHDPGTSDPDRSL